MINFNNKNCDLPRAAEAYFRYLCAINSYTILLAPEGLAYDMIVDFGNGFKKIQIKSTSRVTKRGDEIFRLTRMRTNTNKTRWIRYSRKEIDYFFLYHENKRCWFVPIEIVLGKTSITPSIIIPGYEIDDVE